LRKTERTILKNDISRIEALASANSFEICKNGWATFDELQEFNIEQIELLTLGIAFELYQKGFRTIDVLKELEARKKVYAANHNHFLSTLSHAAPFYQPYPMQPLSNTALQETSILQGGLTLLKFFEMPP
jgi:hypothetical protein